jgi:glycosyltransferase involved in cell wall biosynthesis
VGFCLTPIGISPSLRSLTATSLFRAMPPSQPPDEPIPVAFTFVGDVTAWQGGLNYYRSLFHAVHSHAGELVSLIIFAGSAKTVADLDLPASARVCFSPVFRRGSVPWLVNEFLARVFGKPLISTLVLLRAGVYVHSHSAPSGSKKLRTIAWIPDFQHHHLSKFFTRKELRHRDKYFMHLLKRSDLVVVSSQSAASDLQRFAPEYAFKARVLRFAANSPSASGPQRLDLLSEYGIKGPFFYIPNQFWAHKNHRVAIRALAIIAKERPDVLIVCSGALHDYRNPLHISALKAEINRNGLDQSFVLLGLIPYEHISFLMNAAVGVVNPSLFEGWSTTVEEAKAIGAPLVLSNIDVHREQCPVREAVFFDPMDPVGLAECMLCLLDKPRHALERRSSAEAALQLHQQRRKEFARSFASIVGELR